jgi:hypothetical protein
MQPSHRGAVHASTYCMPRSRFRSCTVRARACNEPSVWRGHYQVAKRGEAGGPRTRRNCEAIGLFLLPCATTGLSLIMAGCLIGATPRGQPWTPAVTLP